MENKENYVTLYVPKGYVSDDPNVFISINGKNYLLMTPTYLSASTARIICSRRARPLSFRSA